MLDTARIIGFVPTTDPERSRAFYQGTLGLKFVKDDGFAQVYDANGTMVRVAKARSFVPAPYTILGWQVPDLDAAARQLTNAGIHFERFGLPGQNELGVWTAPNGDKVAWFKDPDENIVSISQHV
jgi:catechol 2,3-dioxygenase-like lactoylglutathione lyase family enzyme